MGIPRWAAFAGVATPVLFLTCVFGLGALEPGYDHRTLTMSVLGGVGGVRGLLFNLGVGGVGVLILLFGLGLRRALGRGRGNAIGVGLMLLAGAGMLGSAAVPCEAGCVNVLREPDLAGRVHIVTSLLGGMGLGLAPLVLFAPFKRDERWSELAWPTLIFGLVSNLAGVTLWLSLATTRIPAWEGVLQRAGAIAPLLWLGYLGLWALRSPPRPGPREAPSSA